jgi:hypothetical protein
MLLVHLPRQTCPPDISAMITADTGCCLRYWTPYCWDAAQQLVAVQKGAYTPETALQVLAGCSLVQSSIVRDRLWSPLQERVDKTEVQGHSDHRQVEDKHAFHTDLVYTQNNQEVIGGSWDRAERVLSCLGETGRVLDMKMIRSMAVDLLCGSEEVQGPFLSSFLRANIRRSSIT